MACKFLCGPQRRRAEMAKNYAGYTATILAYKENNAKQHAEHVKGFSLILCAKYNALYPEKAIPEEDIRFLAIAAQIHDVGMFFVNDNIIPKAKETVTEEDMQAYKSHPEKGLSVAAELIQRCNLTRHEADIIKSVIRSHHEKYDGAGYPDGLSGDMIPIYAQIVSVAEVYDGLTRANYSHAQTHKEAMDMILSGACGQFSPEMTECLKQVSGNLQKVLSSTGEKRQMLAMKLFGEKQEKKHKRYWIIKRAVDIIASSLGLVLLLPLLLIIAAAIFIDDPHASPIYTQTRVGRHHKNFTMYKFRTMYKDADKRRSELEKYNEKDGPVFKIANDPRITRIGKFLRKTSLDELPQLINVLKGDMTLVGPRPPLPDEVAKYDEYTELRLSVTPGLTCIWQIQPKRDDISFEDWMDMDIDYISRRTVGSDIALLFKTFASVFSESGS